MEHKNDESNMVACLQIVRSYSFIKEVKLYVRVSNFVFLFVKSKINSFI